MLLDTRRVLDMNSLCTVARDRVRLFILVGEEWENSNSSSFDGCSGDIVLLEVYWFLGYL